MSERSRGAVNEIMPGLLQRGKVLTWQREVKVHRFAEWGVRAVVNFWPKIDNDLGEMDLDFYWQLSSPRSEEMLEPRMFFAAEVIRDYIEMKHKPKALILCEAGKTRSVFFCIMVVALSKGISFAAAQKLVVAAVGSVALKPFMLEWIAKRDAKGSK